MSDWIKTSDRLPEEGLHVLTLEQKGSGDYSIRVDYIFDGVFDGNFERRKYNEALVTHWMPLPAPPTASESKMKGTE